MRIRVNERIRIPQIRVIDENGEQLGIMRPQQALEIAKERGYDLVEVAPNVSPPVCRIMDYSRYKYEQEKKEREAKKNQKIIHIKEIKLSPVIEEHDYQVKLNHAKGFIEKGDKVRVVMLFRGRQMAHLDMGRAIIDKMISDTADIAEPEEAPKREGIAISVVIKPKK